MAKLIVTIEGDDSSDLAWLRDRVDGAVGEVIEENRERFDGSVDHYTEYGD